MQESNFTFNNDFILLGFQSLQVFKTMSFWVLLVIYSMTVCGNLLIITLVSYSKNLQTPMYFFLTQLSLSDIMLTTAIAPNMLHNIVNEVGTISFVGCITQYYFFAVTECSECLLLTVMSYDRYLAICKPLHYNCLMDSMLSIKLTIISWLLSISLSLLDTVTLGLLHFCEPQIIDHFFCDYLPLLELSCSDTSVLQLEAIFISLPVLVLPFILIIVSYVYIIQVILRLPSFTERQKAFSTCSSHLTIVSIFYTTLFCIYVLPTRGQSRSISKVLSLFYTVVTPLTNPIIYSLRNKDMKKAFEKCICKIVL
ncbi:olfactory receptor 10A7-like [Pseudophryne corroboree]|uniref:olfactory receptor 10A7-like n=1 Tax=Pseudophryne corroboree TaxID=495146 RepID=UPI0030813A77